MTEGPDFLCVGMLKGGTRWLFDQLQYHPDFWMPPIKELHYFDRGKNRGANAKKALKLFNRSRRKTQSADREYDERDIAFLKEMASHEGRLDMKRYAALFRQKGEKLTGDITPHYCALDNDLIAEITSYLPDLRVLLLIRDPVARAWSQLLQSERHGHDSFPEKTLQDPKELSKALGDWGKLMRLASAADAAKRWKAFVAEDRFRVIFMDDIIERPEETRYGVLTFLGADPAKPSGDLAAGYNSKSGKKAELTSETTAVLVEYLRDEIRREAEVFGGHAVEWARKYGV
jgi:Sulfotransferase family